MTMQNGDGGKSAAQRLGEILRSFFQASGQGQTASDQFTQRGNQAVVDTVQAGGGAIGGAVSDFSAGFTGSAPTITPQGTPGAVMPGPGVGPGLSGTDPGATDSALTQRPITVITTDGPVRLSPEQSAEWVRRGSPSTQSMSRDDVIKLTTPATGPGTGMLVAGSRVTNPDAPTGPAATADDPANQGDGMGGQDMDIFSQIPELAGLSDAITEATNANDFTRVQILQALASQVIEQHFSTQASERQRTQQLEDLAEQRRVDLAQSILSDPETFFTLTRLQQMGVPLFDDPELFGLLSPMGDGAAQGGNVPGGVNPADITNIAATLGGMTDQSLFGTLSSPTDLTRLPPSMQQFFIREGALRGITGQDTQFNRARATPQSTDINPQRR